MCLAVPGRLLEITGQDLERSGRADFGGVMREVSLAFVPETAVGDYVIVHAGVAIARLDEEAAARTFAALAEAGAVE
ncbi:MAG TPA: HypC/HybG/HupF family hydrogenase formation chaperone [Alphaproteobacteria bacterium]|nr:HypC/HybG/HupF family hydrogenase formation chaperone [Alphaproteobacteria bacterium]